MWKLVGVIGVASTLWLVASCGRSGDGRAGAASKHLTSFAFLATDNPRLDADVTAKIDGNTIEAIVPHDTNVTALVAAFTTDGVHVTVKGKPQTSDVTSNNFWGAVSYTVTAADGSTQDYLVTVVIAEDSRKDLTSFGFNAADNPLLPANVTATIADATITAMLPFGTDVTALKATFITTGTNVSVAGMMQMSGLTPQDFATPVTYTVTAVDGSTKSYAVDVMLAKDPRKDITSFWFQAANNPGLAYDIAGTIKGASITANLPYGTDVTALKSSFTTQGVSVAVGATPQISGVTSNDFSSLVTYVVTAADATTKSYGVRLAVAPGYYGGVTTAGDSNPSGVALGDFNGDGRPDIAISNHGADSVSVFLDTTAPGATSATLAAKSDFPTGGGPMSVVAADFNGDGMADLAIANESANTVSILLDTTTANATTAAFTAKVDFATAGAPISVTSADINADGKPDLVVANYTAGTVSILLDTTTTGATTPTFASRVDLLTTPSLQSVAVGDLNGDGKPDVAAAGTTGYVSILLNTTTAGATAPSFASHQDIFAGTYPIAVAIGDIDGDGKPDLAVANYTPSTTSVLLNTIAAGSMTATFSGPTTLADLDMYPRSVAIADITGDGRADVVIASEQDFGVEAFVNTADVSTPSPSFSAPFSIQTDTSSTVPMSVALGDLNGDSKPDIVVANGAWSVSVVLHR